LIRNGIHPMQIVRSYSIFNEIVEKHLMEYQAITVNPYEECNREIILQMVKTTLNSKISSVSLPKLANIAVEAMFKTKGQKNMIQIIKLGEENNSITYRGASIDDTQLIQGYNIVLNTNFVQEHEQQGISLKKVKIAVILFDLDKPKSHSRIDDLDKIDSSQIDRILKEEENYIKKIVVQLRKIGVNAICVQENIAAGYQAGISDTAKHWLQKSKIHCLKPLKKTDIHTITAAFQIHTLTSVEKLQELTPNSEETMKYVKQVDRIEHLVCGNQTYISMGQTKEQGLAFPHTTIVLSAPNKAAVDEMERSFHDAIRVMENFLKTPVLVPGGGACEMSLSAHILQLLARPTSKYSTIQKLVMESFANALESIPHILSRGCSSHQSPSELVNQLRQIYTDSLQNQKPSPQVGIFLDPSTTSPPICNLVEQGIYELYQSKLSQLKMALQTVQRILKIHRVFIMETPKH